VTGSPQSVHYAVERKQVDVATAITRLFKQSLRFLSLARGRRRAKSASQVCPPAAKPQVLGVGLGSAFFPPVRSSR